MSLRSTILEAYREGWLRMLTVSERMGIHPIYDGPWAQLSPYVCRHCGPVWDLGVKNYHPATYWQPEEGEPCCPECGSDEVGPRQSNENPLFRATRRHSITLPHRMAA